MPISPCPSPFFTVSPCVLTFSTRITILCSFFLHHIRCLQRFLSNSCSTCFQPFLLVSYFNSSNIVCCAFVLCILHIYFVHVCFIFFFVQHVWLGIQKFIYQIRFRRQDVICFLSVLFVLERAIYALENHQR